jgi:cytochrome c oxidase subunit 2
MNQFRLFPERAATIAEDVDTLYLFLWTVSGFFTLLIFVLIVYFALKYNRRRNVPPQNVRTSYWLEVVWTAIPFVLVMTMFGWGARIYVQSQTPPRGAMDIHIIGKQWMWKTQHPTGQREINELHVPVNTPIRLVMASQDVIHSFYVPAFRTKRDVVPGRYNFMWFTATVPGEYRLFCAEYCGSHHSAMGGRVVVMEAGHYESWLAGVPPDEPPIVAGEKLFAQFACNTCHGQRAPTVAGLYGRTVQLADGQTVVADDAYLRESIVNPSAKMVAGYAPLMPSYQGQMTEEQLLNLIAYIKSLRSAATQPTE